MANTLAVAFDIDTPAAPVEISINNGASWAPLTVPAAGNHKTANLLNVPAGFYDIGFIQLRGVGYSTSVVKNLASVTVAGAATVAPTITGISPSTGAVGAAVTITGTNLTNATAVTFNGVAATFTVINATTINATAPAGGTGTITVTTAGGTATSTGSFTVTVAATGPLDPNFVIDGDSIGTQDYANNWRAGFQTELTNQLAFKTLAQLNAVGLTATAPTFAYVAISGQTTAMMDSAAADVAGAFVAGKSNTLLTIAEPYNTLRFSTTNPAQITTTPAQAATDYANYCNNRKAANAWKGIVGLVGFDDNYRGADTNFNPPRAGFAQLQADMITAIRGRITAGTAGVDVLAVVDPIFDQTDPAQSADGVHPTNAAWTASLTKRLVAGVMEMLFGTVQPAAIPRSADLLAGAQFLSFPTQNGNIVTTGNVFTSNKGGAVYGALGLCNYKLPAAGAGWYAAEIFAADSFNAITAFSDANAYASYTAAATRAGFFRDANGLNVINNGVYVASVGTCAVGDFVRIRRAGSALTLEKSSDRGATWTLVYTYPYTSAADLFLIADIYSTGKLYYPQGFNMVPSTTNTVANLIPGASYINFPTTTKVVNSNNVMYSRMGTPTGVYGGTQLPVVKLPAGINGYIAYRFADPTAFDSVLFFRADLAEGGYATAQAGSWVSSGNAGSPNQQVARYDSGASGGGRHGHAGYWRVCPHPARHGRRQNLPRTQHGRRHLDPSLHLPVLQRRRPVCSH